MARADLNGRNALVVSFDAQHGRYTVDVDGTQVALKPANMQASAPPPLQAPVEQVGGPQILPAGWTLELDPASGEQYYYNTANGESSWERPKGAFHGSV